MIGKSGVPSRPLAARRNRPSPALIDTVILFFAACRASNHVCSYARSFGTVSRRLRADPARAQRKGVDPASLRPPTSYDELIEQAQLGTMNALADGCELLEIEFPPSGLYSVAGDAEGDMPVPLAPLTHPLRPTLTCLPMPSPPPLGLA